MDAIFFNTDYTTLSELLLRVVAFLALGGLILYLVYLLLSRLLLRKSGLRKEIGLRLTLLWSLLVFFTVFNLYLCAFFYREGINAASFTSGRFYLSVLAQLILYVGLIGFFFLRRQSLKRMINETQIH